MGLVITLFAAIITAGLAIAQPRILPYLFLGLIVFFEEFGAGFTSLNGSFVFNQAFVSFYNLKFIEIVTASAWLPLVLLGRHKSQQFVMRSEKRIGIVLLLLIIGLLIAEYFLHQTVQIGDWRLFITGAMLIHMLSVQLDSEERVTRFITVFIIFLSARALIGFLMYLFGYGVVSPRGMTAFFWDSRQVDAFAFGLILLAAYLANFRSLTVAHRILPRAVAILMFIILTLTILYSFRRTIWMVSFLGVGAVVLLSQRVKIHHYVFLSALMLTSVLVIAVIPNNNGNSRLTTYISTMKIFDKREASNIENEVHFDNIVQYTRMITEQPYLFFLGIHGLSTRELDQLQTSYSDRFRLGQAHNGILRSIYFFGIGGLLIYFWFYLRIFRRFPTVRRSRETSILKHAAIASLVFLFAEFSAALVFVPPFYTSIKGLYFTFIAIFLVNASLFFAKHISSSHTYNRNRAK